MMIMKQKRKTEVKTDMEKNEKGLLIKLYVAEILTAMFAMSISGLFSVILKNDLSYILRNIVISGICIFLTGYCIRQCYLYDEYDYDNGKFVFRYWSGLLVSLLVGYVCVFMPPGGWPLIPVFVGLSLLSNPLCGLVGGFSVTFIISILSNCDIEILILYLLCGIISVSLFRKFDEEVHVGIKIFISMLCLFICELANIYLTLNSRIEVESFIVPLANVIISSIITLGIIKVFSSAVIFKYRDKYLELNDTEYELLSNFRKEHKEDYMHCIHTEYFCERIAARLGFDIDSLKCAGYYHKLVSMDKSILSTVDFPPAAYCILSEYSDKKNPIKSKETCVLICADTIMNSIQYLIKKSDGKKVDYDSAIDSVFAHFEKNDTFSSCDISISQLNTIKAIFKEEKLYYDFLH